MNIPTVRLLLFLPSYGFEMRPVGYFVVLDLTTVAKWTHRSNLRHDGGEEACDKEIDRRDNDICYIYRPLLLLWFHGSSRAEMSTY